MRKQVREVVADWLLLAGAVGLLVSLFLPWSRRFSALPGFPRQPTAWQVYSVADVGFALLVAGLLLAALLGGRLRRLGVLLASAIALAFTIHAAGTPPTNGALSTPQAGAGETVAIAALGVAIAALGLSFSAD